MRRDLFIRLVIWITLNDALLDLLNIDFMECELSSMCEVNFDFLVNIKAEAKDVLTSYAHKNYNLTAKFTPFYPVMWNTTIRHVIALSYENDKKVLFRQLKEMETNWGEQWVDALLTKMNDSFCIIIFQTGYSFLDNGAPCVTSCFSEAMD